MLTAVVLAAGAGTRLGGPKALAPLAGRTFLDRVLATCAASLVDEVVVVTGCRREQVEAALPAGLGVPVRRACNADWETGRTGSVQAGWRAATEGSHVLLFPVDHPAVRVVTLDLLCGAFGYAAQAPEVVVPVLQDSAGARRRGHPIVLAATLREAVLALASYEPLHDLVRRSVALEVPVDDPGILLDVDTPEDLARAEALLAES